MQSCDHNSFESKPESRVGEPTTPTGGEAPLSYLTFTRLRSPDTSPIQEVSPRERVTSARESGLPDVEMEVKQGPIARMITWIRDHNIVSTAASSLISLCGISGALKLFAGGHWVSGTIFALSTIGLGYRTIRDSLRVWREEMSTSSDRKSDDSQAQPGKATKPLMLKDALDYGTAMFLLPGVLAITVSNALSGAHPLLTAVNAWLVLPLYSSWLRAGLNGKESSLGSVREIFSNLFTREPSNKGAECDRSAEDSAESLNPGRFVRHPWLFGFSLFTTLRSGIYMASILSGGGFGSLIAAATGAALSLGGTLLSLGAPDAGTTSSKKA